MFRRGRAVLFVGLALGVASLASAGVAAAEPPEFGHCSVPLYLPNGSGTYADSNCTTSGELNRYDWYPSTKGEAFFSKGKSTFATAAGAVTCSGVRALGFYTSPKTIGNFPFRFTGCQLGGALCASGGASAGEVRTSTLEATLGTDTVMGKHRTLVVVAAVQLTPPSGASFAEFSCGATSVVLDGAPIAQITHSTKVRSLALEFKVKQGRQAMYEISDVFPEFPESSVDGGPFTPMTVKAKLKNLNYDDTLVNMVV
jgi:hypothetical protein